MGSFIFKVRDKKGNAYYGEWSTVVDAPVTYLMSLKNFRQYYRYEYGASGMKGLLERMERVEKTGCSGLGESLEDLLSYNRAGEKESHIKTELGLLRKYKLKPKKT